MNSTELNNLIRQIGEELDTYDQRRITEELIKELKAGERVDAIRIMAPSYVHHIWGQQSRKTTARSVTDSTTDFRESLPAGAHKMAPMDVLVRQNPHLAGHAKAVRQSQAKKFVIFGIEYTIATFSVFDMREIASKYYAIGDSHYRIAERLGELANDLEGRGCETLGELRSTDAIELFTKPLSDLSKEALRLAVAA